MKRSVKYAIVAALAFILAFSGSHSVGAQAAENVTKDSQKYVSHSYKYIVEDFSQRITGKVNSVDVSCYSMRLELSGYGKAGKKINKQLKALVQLDPSYVFEGAEALADMGKPAEKIEEYYDCVRSWVEYNDGKYLSVAVSREAWTGGVENTFNTGYTFSLKTGKPVPITKATGLTLDQIKERLAANMKADGNDYDETSFITLDGMKESDFRYYLQDGNVCVVTFGPYEISYGGWFRIFKIEY